MKKLNKLLIKTSVDKLFDVLQRRKEISIDEAAAALGVSEEQIEKWIRILEERKLLKLKYPTIGKAKICVIPKEHVVVKAKEFKERKKEIEKKAEKLGKKITKAETKINGIDGRFYEIEEDLHEKLVIAEKSLSELEKLRSKEKELISELKTWDKSKEKFIQEIKLMKKSAKGITEKFNKAEKFVKSVEKEITKTIKNIKAHEKEMEKISLDKKMIDEEIDVLGREIKIVEKMGKDVRIPLISDIVEFLKLHEEKKNGIEKKRKRLHKKVSKVKRKIKKIKKKRRK